MKKKSIQRIAAWLLAAGMMAGTFAQPMAVYAESTASIAASDSTTGDSITADADVVIATPTPEPDTGTDTAATPVPTADSQTPQDPASTAAPETTPAPDAAEDVPTPTPTPTPTPAAEDTADDAADTDDTTDTTTTVTPADLQSCIALLAASQLSLDADSIEPDVREETLALSDEITETEPSTLQAVVNAAVFAAPAGQTDIVVDVPAGNYTGTLVIPDATIVGKDANGNEININYTNKNIVLNMTGSTLTVPTDAAVGVSVFGSLTIRGGTIKAADGCTATRGVQVQLGSALTLDSTTISDFTYAGPGAGVYVKGTAAVDTNGQFDVALGKNQEPLQNADNTYQFKKLQRENGNSMDTSFTMKGGTTITNCKSDGNGAALYVHNAALLTLENANFTTNNAGGFGGAVYLGTGVQTTIGDGVTFTGNHAAKDGGALYLANQYTLHVKADNILVQVPVTFNGGTFTDNSTDTYGGALAFDPAFDGIADNTIENVTFGQVGTTTSDDENAEEETTLHGNYAALRGGAIAFNSNIKENTLKKCTFRGNTALRYTGNNTNLVLKDTTISNMTYTSTDHGAGIRFGGAGVLEADGCTFANNRVESNCYGGAIFMNSASSKATITNSTFTNNYARNVGGAMFLNSHTITLRGNTFAGNSTSDRGGAIYMQPRINTEKAESKKYGAYDVVLENNTFENNTAYSAGGAICVDPGNIDMTYLIDGCTFKNNCSSANAGGAVYQYNGTLTLGTGNRFEENKSYSGGSGMYVGGNLYSVRDLLGVELPGDSYDTQFIKNTAGYGNYSGGNAALSVSGGATKNMRYMLFDGNVAAYGNTASAIYIGTGSASTAQRDMWIDHCRFENNVGNRYTVYVDTNYTNKNLLKINNTVFDSNTVKYGRTDGDAALLYIAYGNSVQMSDCTITKTQGEGRILRYYGGGTLDKDGNAFPATGTFTNVTI